MKIANALIAFIPHIAPRHGRKGKVGRKSRLGVLAVLCLAIAPAFGDLAATARISAVPNGPIFDYTISVTNTGSTSIGTFWFAWTPPGMPIEYDFLPSLPFSISQPAGWLGPASPGFPGNSIEYYNSTGSPLAPGQTGTFSFSSPDSPATLQGSTFGFPNTTSFIYEGSPLVGSTARVDPVFFAPDSGSSYALLAIALPGLLGLRRVLAA